MFNRWMIRFLVFSSFGASGSTYADQLRNCNIEGLTKACSVLDDEKQDGLSEFSDGSFYFNPRELAKMETFDDPSKPEAIARKNEILQNWHSYIYDYDLKKWNPGFIDSILDETFIYQMASNPPPATITVCWPPEKSAKTCTLKEVSYKILQPILQSKPDANHGFDFETVAFYQGSSLKSLGGSFESAIDAIKQKEAKARELNKDKVNRIAEKVRKNLIETITAGRNEKDLSSVDKALIAKIKTITINHGDDSNVASFEACKGISPNAFYEPSTHSMNFCDSIYGVSEASLALTIAHEMGHAIDPCNFRNTLWVKQTDQSTSFANTPMRLSERYKSFTRAAPIDEDSALKYYPFSSVYQCLQENYDLETANTTDEERNAETLKRQDRLTRRLGKVENERVPPMVIAFYRTNIKNDCTKSTNMNEAMADWFAGETVGTMIQKGDLKPETLTSSPMMFAMMGCWQKEEIKGSHNKKAMFLALDSHPIARDRADILVQNPTLKKAMGCITNPTKTNTRCPWVPESKTPAIPSEDSKDGEEQVK